MPIIINDSIGCKRLQGYITLDYNYIFKEKATMEKSVFTNIVESINSSLRSEISFLTRQSNKHTKALIDQIITQARHLRA